MNKYELRTNNKKSAIMEATLTLINEKGFTASSIQQIASLAKVSPVSIYNYYGSKEKLVLECIKLIITKNFNTARSILESNLAYEDKLVKALSLCSNDLIVSMSEYFTTTSLAENNFLKILNECHRDIQRNLYRDFIEVGKKERAIAASIPTETILKFIDSFDNLPLNATEYKSEIQNLHKLLLHGILG